MDELRPAAGERAAEPRLDERPRLTRTRRIAIRLASAWANLREASICLWLGMKICLERRVLWRTVPLGICTGVFATWAFVHFYQQVGSVAAFVAVTLVFGLLMPLGVIGNQAKIPYLSSGGTTASGFSEVLVPGLPNAAIELMRIGQVLMYLLAILLLTVALLWVLAYVLGTTLIGRTWLKRVISPLLAQAYPSSSQSPSFPTYRRGYVRRLLWGLGLCLPFIGGVLMLAVLCRGLLRLEITGLASQLVAKDQRRALASDCGDVAFWLGLILLFVAVIPPLNLLLPALLPAAAGHLVHRRIIKRTHTA